MRLEGLRASFVLAVGVWTGVPTRVVAQQPPTGYVSTFVDYLPNRHDTIEWRSRLFLEERIEPAPYARITLSGFAEGLVARRPRPRGVIGESDRISDGILRVQDANIELTARKVDFLAGFARVVWGKLDEIQPTDVINPLDVSRFFFDGRTEARLPVALARIRVFVTDDVTVEGVYVPAFRRGRFDQLDEPSSPFNLAASVTVPAMCLQAACILPEVVRTTPAFTAGNAQGGVRLSTTKGRVDWSVSAYRGFEAFGLSSAAVPLQRPTASVPLAVNGFGIRETYPRFTMLGGDVEAVRAAWGLRGEIAVFVEDSFQSADLRIVGGHSLDAGAGLDRRAGPFTVSVTVLYHRESYESALVTLEGVERGRSDVSLIASADRTFAREKYRARVFSVYNPVESSGFVRAIGIASVRDNFSVEASVGWFAGSGPDLVGRFSDDDFMYLRLKYYF